MFGIGFSDGVFAIETLTAARQQMALSLGFHIILSCFGVAFPFLIFLLHRRGLRKNDDVALTLARRWSKVAAVLFAVGAVSGTVLSFEMGLLWPGLMSKFGDVIGLAFGLEGIAFFLEAIFLGIYLYGWNRLDPKIHIWTLLPIILSGAFGTFCIISVNAWMNAPSGFAIENGVVTDISPLAAMFNSAVAGQALHMFIAAYMVTGFLVASVYAVGILKGRRDEYHKLALRYALTMAALFAIVQPIVGHVSGWRLATDQPAKVAAIELSVTPESRAPLIVAGWLVGDEVKWSIQIPLLGSFFSTNSIDGTVPGLDQFPPDERPPANIVHYAFQTMVAVGSLLAAFSIWFLWRERKKRSLIGEKWPMRFVAVSGLMAVVALESGWIVTEVGRQPWIVYNIMKVSEAVTTSNYVWVSLALISILYLAIGIATVLILRSMASRWRAGEPDALPTPYSPETLHV